MSEESRRELIARQHRALYGNESPAFFPPGSLGDDAHAARADNPNSATPTSSTGGVRGASPRAVDPFGIGQSQPDGLVQGGAPSAGRQSPPRANSTRSPSTGANASYGLYDSNVEQSTTSTSSPGGAESTSSRQLSSKPTGSVGPIGSRPSQPATSQAGNPALNKRSTTPLPSPLGLGFTPSESAAAANERSASATSNHANTNSKENTFASGWGTNSGVWGSKNLGVQASVWG